MRNIVLFIAMSLDGYIADINGKVDWLAGQDSDVENNDSYADFVKNIDTVIMGWTTYHQIVRNCRKIIAQTSKPFMMYDHP